MRLALISAKQTKRKTNRVPAVLLGSFRATNGFWITTQGGAMRRCRGALPRAGLLEPLRGSVTVSLWKSHNEWLTSGRTKPHTSGSTNWRRKPTRDNDSRANRLSTTRISSTSLPSCRRRPGQFLPIPAANGRIDESATLDFMECGSQVPLWTNFIRNSSPEVQGTAGRLSFSRCVLAFVDKCGGGES